MKNIRTDDEMYIDGKNLLINQQIEILEESILDVNQLYLKIKRFLN